MFFSGTQSFRDASYAAASSSWQALVDLEEVPSEFERYKTNAYNNLGFLYFQGWGVQKDRDRAVNYWKVAAKVGHEESEYHLCHAYGDPLGPTPNPPLALEYCKEALHRYLQLTERRSVQEKIVDQLKRFISELEEERR